MSGKGLGRHPSRRPRYRDLATSRSGPPSTTGEDSGVLGEAPEAPLALLVVADRLEQVLAGEIRPEDRREPEFRVGDLPEQEVRDPHLAARPDQEIRLGHVGG